MEDINVLALCSGVGGLELGLKLATRGKARTVCHVEREAYAASVLVARMQDGTLDQAPIWGDLRSFDARDFRSKVEIVTAGYPCQPFSSAGKRLGAEDPRHLWPEVARVVDECRPRYVFCENVGAHLRNGFDIVAGDLHSLGYRVAATLHTAQEHGAPHKRERLFWLATADTDGKGEHAQPVHAEVACQSSGYVSDAESGGRKANRLPERAQQTFSGSIVYRGWGTEPAMGRVADGVANRVDRLRAIGNGVVPIVAANAFLELLDALA